MPIANSRRNLTTDARVIVDGRAVPGCLYLAAFVADATVSTIEHAQPVDAVAPGDDLDTVQRAFIECGALQMRVLHARLRANDASIAGRNPDPDDDDIRHYLSGNLCRCAAYPEVIEAVKLAALRMQASSV